MNDTGTRTPEPDIVFGTRRRQEVVDLLVDILGASKILLTADLSFDQVIAVHCGRSSDRGHAGRHELKDCHLSSCILTCNTIRSQF